MQVRIFLTSPEKYFYTETPRCRPVFKIHDARLVMEFLLLKQNLLTNIEKRLQKSALQISFQANFVKTYTIPEGVLEYSTDITTKDPYTECILFLSTNTNFLGMYKENYFEFKRHGLEHCYISSG